MHLPILARGDRWLVVAKPSGLPIHRSKLVRTGPTLVQVVRAQLQQRADPVHRLDQPTSGCLLMSLDPTLTSSLQRALVPGPKRYLALVRGAMREPRVIDRALKVDGKPREALTRLTPVGWSQAPRCALVLAEPSTGRFHQIRRHLAGIGHPVLGDSTHGDTRVNRVWREQHGLHRLALHCLSLATVAPHPIRVVCPVPTRLQELWKTLPWWTVALAAVPELGLPFPEPRC